MSFYIEDYDYVKHMQRLILMEPDAHSVAELRSPGLHKDLGFSTKQVLLDWAISSDSCWYFLDRKTKRIVGVTGCAQQIHKGELVAVPWFISTGFHRAPGNTRKFLRALQAILHEWQRHARGRLFINKCINTGSNNRLLRHLGFLVEPMGHQTIYHKKGVTHVRSCTNDVYQLGFHTGPNQGKQSGRNLPSYCSG